VVGTDIAHQFTLNTGTSTTAGASVCGATFALPFAAMFSTPLLIYVGQIPPERYAEVMGLQVLWVVALGLVAALLWRAGARRVVVQGG